MSKKRADKKLGTMRKTGGTWRTAKPRNVVKKDITRDEFHSLVKKAAQPIEGATESDSTSTGT